MKSLIVSLALASVAMASAAKADDDKFRCRNVPVTERMSIEDLHTKVAQMGIDIHEIELDDGCYEVEGRNRDGRKVEIRLDPKTADQVSIDWDDD